MHKSLRTFLVDEGYIEPHHLRMALGHQERLRHKTLGEILVERYGVTADALAHAVHDQYEAICRMDHGEHPQVLEVFLVEQGVVDEETVAAARWWQQRLQSKRLGDILIELGFIDRERLEEAIRAQLAELSVA